MVPKALKKKVRQSESRKLFYLRSKLRKGTTKKITNNVNPLFSFEYF